MEQPENKNLKEYENKILSWEAEKCWLFYFQVHDPIIQDPTIHDSCINYSNKLKQLSASVALIQQINWLDRNHVHESKETMRSLHKLSQ